MLKFLCLLCLTAIAGAEVIEKFTSNEIIPDVINGLQESELKVTFPSGNEVKLGNVLTPTQVKDEPSVEWVAEEDTFYTLLLTDPDAPSRAQPAVREWHHWLVGNIQGSNVASGDVLSQYVSSAPPLDSGLHRYVFLLFKQPSGRIDYSEVPKIAYSGEGRAKFNTKNFQNKYMLTAIAGNFYQAQYDDSVPAIHKALGF
ncbi:unnamed protein product [Diamesa hyperborea]